MDSVSADSVSLPTAFRTWTANGTKLVIRGEKQLNVITNDLQELSMTKQMVDVIRPLHSVSRIWDNHNVVVFHRAGG